MNHRGELEKREPCHTPSKARSSRTEVGTLRKRYREGAPVGFSQEEPFQGKKMASGQEEGEEKNLPKTRLWRKKNRPRISGGKNRGVRLCEGK